MLNRREFLAATALTGFAAATQGVTVAGAAVESMKPPPLALVGKDMSDFQDVLQGVIRLRDVEKVYLSTEDFRKFVCGDRLSDLEDWLMSGRPYNIVVSGTPQQIAYQLVEE